MSQIIATTLSNGSVSVPTATVVNGSAKAWVNFNGTGTIAARDSFNVASLTDNGTGDYTVTYSNNMANNTYGISVASIENGTNAADIFVSNNTDPSVSSHILEYVLPGVAKYDVARIYSIIHGDLA